MASVNKWIGIGTLGKDVEMRYLPDGKAIANFSIACNENWKDKNGQKQEKTEWIKISIFGKLAEIACEYLTKGSSVYIEGRIQTRKWQDKEGKDNYSTEVVADRMQMLGGKTKELHDSEQKSMHHDKSGFDTMEDDIPFV